MTIGVMFWQFLPIILGVEPIQVNLSGDSTFGLGRKLVSLVKKMTAGKNFLIHPDGPEGPAYKVKPGLSFIAQKTGAPSYPWVVIAATHTILTAGTAIRCRSLSVRSISSLDH